MHISTIRFWHAPNKTALELQLLGMLSATQHQASHWYKYCLIRTMVWPEVTDPNALHGAADACQYCASSAPISRTVASNWPIVRWVASCRHCHVTVCNIAFMCGGMPNLCVVYSSHCCAFIGDCTGEVLLCQASTSLRMSAARLFISIELYQRQDAYLGHMG